MLLRPADEGDGFTYHPLLREFLVERLDAERTEDERRRLHAAVAPAIAAAGDPIEAIEHWLAARALAGGRCRNRAEGPDAGQDLRQPDAEWLSTLPIASRELPTMLSLEGQLEWGAGDHMLAARCSATP